MKATVGSDQLSPCVSMCEVLHRGNVVQPRRLLTGSCQEVITGINIPPNLPRFNTSFKAKIKHVPCSKGREDVNRNREIYRELWTPSRCVWSSPPNECLAYNVVG